VKLAEHPEADFVVGVVKTLTNEQVEGGMFVHLGIEGSERPPTSSVRLVPEADMGRYFRARTRADGSRPTPRTEDL